MAFSMADELSTEVADYTATELSVTPQGVLPTIGSKNQQILWLDDGTPYTINIDDTTTYQVDLSWDYVTPTEAETIMDMWGDQSKANGMVNTFYWVHPTDGETYVVRFISKPVHQERAGQVSHHGVMSVSFFVSGKKA
ncbi:MAG: hypothetical protein GY861_19105 [bacterium]|nr:hypothetical protein [bacterium]